MSFNLTQSEFFNKIKPQINLFGIKDGSKEMAEAKNITNSIFDKYDTQTADGNVGKDGVLNQAELDAAKNISQEVMLAIDSYLTATETQAPSQTDSVAEADTPVSPDVKDEVNNFNNLTPEQQTEAIKKEIDDIIASGGSIIDFDGDNITVVMNGQEEKISLSQLGVSAEAMGTVRETVETAIVNTSLDKAGYTQDDFQMFGQMGLSNSIGENGEFLFIKDGNVIGTVSNDADGKPVYDEGAKMVNVSTVLGRYGIQESNIKNITNYTATNSKGEQVEVIIIEAKDDKGNSQVIVCDEKTGKEMPKEE